MVGRAPPANRFAPSSRDASKGVLQGTSRMTDTNHAALRHDRPPIEELDEIEQDAVFDAMMAAYCDPPADVRDRLGEIAARTRAVLGGS